MNQSLYELGIGEALYLSLHDLAPGQWQSDREVDFIGYRRMPVPRSPEFWDVQGDTVTLRRDIVFPECTRGSSLVRCCAIGSQATGRGPVLYTFEIQPTVMILPGVLFMLRSGSSITDIESEVAGAIQQADMVGAMRRVLAARPKPKPRMRR